LRIENKGEQDMVTEYQKDPWVRIRTANDLPADEVISTLQKEIRRGNTENAVLAAYEMLITSPELESKLWQRLFVISVEDIGMGEPQAPILINSLFQMHYAFPEGAGDRYVFAIHAVRYLCSCLKDRSSDEMLNWIARGGMGEQVIPEIPDYAIDMHTARGQKMGRGFEHFLAEGAQIHPELEGRDNRYYKLLRNLD
jgi:replication-associated recombination protein RarA